MVFIVTVLLAWLSGSAMIFAKVTERRQRRSTLLAALAVGTFVSVAVAIALIESRFGYGAVYLLLGSWLAFPIMFIVGTFLGETGPTDSDDV